MFGLTDSIHQYLLRLDSGAPFGFPYILVCFYPGDHTYFMDRWVTNAILIVAGVAIWKHPRLTYFGWQLLLVNWMWDTLLAFPVSYVSEYGLMQGFIPFLIAVPILFLFREPAIYALFDRKEATPWWAYLLMVPFFGFVAGFINIIFDLLLGFTI